MLLTAPDSVKIFIMFLLLQSLSFFLCWSVYPKTSTSATINGVTSATNDVGVITWPDGSQLDIVVFVSDTNADEKTPEEVIARMAETAWDR